MVNNVSLLNFKTPVVNPDGIITRQWAIFFRDLYERTSGESNAIDNLANESGQSLLTVNSSIDEIVEQINQNQNDFAEYIETDFELASEDIAGVVKRMLVVTDAVETTVSVVAPDATTAPGTYDQAQIETIVVLANANKAAINAIAADLNSAIVKLNQLIANSKTSGQMTE